MASGLPERHLRIQEEQLKQMQRNIWSERFENAEMTIWGEVSPIKVRYRGGHTREYPKRSYEVVRGGKTYHYNAEYDDPSLLRNALSFRFFERIGVPAPKTKHCLLYLNGKSLGVYLEIESVDRNFFRKRGISVQSLFYAVNDNANFSLMAAESSRRKASLLSGYQKMIGTSSDERALVRFINRINMERAGSKALLSYLQRRLDIENYLLWLAGAVFTGNYDGFEQNYSIYRHKASQKYRMIPWDYEGTWGRNCFGKPCGSDLVKVYGYNELTKRLLRYSTIRQRYKELLGAVLKKHFTVQNIVPVALEMHDSIRPYVYRDSSRRWSFSVFDDEPEFIRKYVEERRRLIADELRKM